jgi:hypothetical protein
VINAAINSKILSIWRKQFGSQDVLAPIFYDDFKAGSVVFVGVNPSTNSRGLRKMLAGTPYADYDLDLIHRWSNIAAKPERIDDSIAIGRYVVGNYGYFKRMHEIAKAVGAPLQHLDLFVYRQTSQKDFLTYIRDGKKGHDFSEFGKEQLAIFHDALVASKPKVIVVANAFASQILRDTFSNNISFDAKRGFHWLKLDGSKVPIFFSSMLSGQRALDTGSYERLLWHVVQASKVEGR